MIEDLVATAASLDRLAAERALSWEFDPTLVRGMGYYTGQVFEITHPDMSGSVAGGGRYDKLIGRSLGHDVPACGFSIGFERIVDLLARRRRGTRWRCWWRADVPVADALDGGPGAARRLSGAGRVVETVRRSGKFGAQLKRLEAAGFGGFVLVGPRTARWCAGSCGRWAASIAINRRQGGCAVSGILSYALAITVILHECFAQFPCKIFLHVPMHLHLLC